MIIKVIKSHYSMRLFSKTHVSHSLKFFQQTNEMLNYYVAKMVSDDLLDICSLGEQLSISFQSHIKP